VTQSSVRQAIGIVPQDTVLFNDTIEYNIAYGRPGASRSRGRGRRPCAAHIHNFIVSTPKGYDADGGRARAEAVGGEKQRVAIARTLLKNPPILIFDEATSPPWIRPTSAPSRLNCRAVAQNKTTLVIAHRLSTVVDAHEILVMDGRAHHRARHARRTAGEAGSLRLHVGAAAERGLKGVRSWRWRKIRNSSRPPPGT
jgi:ABC-type transport system involved in Fe-S cluster assembly fused permease/ATPase subunit